MKVYIAKDWTGSKVFAEPPVLMKCGGMPDIWSGHKLPFDIKNSFTEDEIGIDVSNNNFFRGSVKKGQVKLINWTNNLNE